MGKPKISDEKLLAALLAAPTISAAAAVAGCGERTVYARLKSPEFARKLEDMRRKSLETARNALLSRLTAAVDTMADVMENAENSPSTRLQAARMLIDSTLRVVETVDIERRIAELERRELSRGR